MGGTEEGYALSLGCVEEKKKGIARTRRKRRL